MLIGWLPDSLWVASGLRVAVTRLRPLEVQGSVFVFPVPPPHPPSGAPLRPFHSIRRLVFDVRCWTNRAGVGGRRVLEVSRAPFRLPPSSFPRPLSAFLAGPKSDVGRSISAFVFPIAALKKPIVEVVERKPLRYVSGFFHHQPPPGVLAFCFLFSAFCFLTKEKAATEKTAVAAQPNPIEQNEIIWRVRTRA